MEQLIFKNQSEIKDVNETQGIIEGYANVYNIKDLQGDISMPGSFTKTATEQKQRIKIYKNHNPEILVGIPQELDVSDPYGLRLIAKMNMETQAGKDAFLEAKFLIENGFESGFSIGGYVMKRNPKNKAEVLEYKLKEISLLTKDPANQLSLVDTVKAVKEMTDITQDEFWKAIEKAYNEKFSDEMLKSLEIFLSLKNQEPGKSTPDIEPNEIIKNIYLKFI